MRSQPKRYNMKINQMSTRDKPKQEEKERKQQQDHRQRRRGRILFLRREQRWREEIRLEGGDGDADVLCSRSRCCFVLEC